MLGKGVWKHGTFVGPYWHPYAVDATLGFLPPDFSLDKQVVFLWVKLLSGKYSITFTCMYPKKYKSHKFNVRVSVFHGQTLMTGKFYR